MKKQRNISKLFQVHDELEERTKDFNLSALTLARALDSDKTSGEMPDPFIETCFCAFHFAYRAMEDARKALSEELKNSKA